MSATLFRRILMLWKRKTSKDKEKQVDLLIQALQEMGRSDVAETIRQQHMQNAELTEDCFQDNEVLL